MIDFNDLSARYAEALSHRRAWESLWRDCYDYALPNQQILVGKRDGQRRTDHIFDATAMDGVDGLATALLGQVTPPWSAWFTLKAGPALSNEDAARAAPRFDVINRTVMAQIAASNFTVEMHQCFLELVTAGTACLAIQEAPLGASSTLRFEAVPLADIVLAQGEDGRLSQIYRPMIWTRGAVKARFPDHVLRGDDDADITLVDAVLHDEGRLVRVLFIPDEEEGGVLETSPLSASPYIAFRWQKAAGEHYGRSPVMKALPDIKTANKVVELILKNASIAVTGIWLADDDGVLNPATITLEPGTIIPKAVGSQGLKPLEMPARFDVSQLVLDDLRARIRGALLIDRLTSPQGKNMTATEVLERGAENALLLAATYGRLQAELLTPLLERVFTILIGRGIVPHFDVDSETIVLDIRSPMAGVQVQRNVQTMVSWLEAASRLGPDVMAVIDKTRLVARIAAELGVASDLITQPQPLEGV